MKYLKIHHEIIINNFFVINIYIYIYIKLNHSTNNNYYLNIFMSEKLK